MQPAAAPVSRRSRRKRLLFGLMLCGFLYVLAETGAYFVYWAVAKEPFSYERVWDEQGQRSRGEESSPVPHGAGAGFSRFVHPYLGYVYRNLREDRVNDRQGNLTDFGFGAGGQPIPKRSPEKVIIGILGGSVAGDFSVEGVGALERHLKASPRFAGKRFEFVNLAMGGYKQPQQLFALTYLLSMRAEFDIVINIDGFNEVALYPAEQAANGVFPLYPRTWHLLASDVPDPEFRRRVGIIAYHQKERQDWAARFVDSPVRYSMLASLVWKVRDRRLGKMVWDAQGDANRHRLEQRTYPAVGPQHRYPDEEAMYADLVATWSHCSVQLDRLCHANGIAYFHFLQPNQYVAGSKPIGPEERQAAWLDSHMYKPGAERGYPLLIEAGKELPAQGVKFRDLTRIFAQHPEPIYHDTCCHFNGRGHALMARAIADALLMVRIL